MRHDDEHGGYPLGNPFRRRHEADDPLGATNETPVDLAAVQADDALLDMLGGAEVARGDADADLARVLVAWRRDVDAEPPQQGSRFYAGLAVALAAVAPIWALVIWLVTR